MYQPTPHTTCVCVPFSFNDNSFPVSVGKYSHKFFNTHLTLAITAESRPPPASSVSITYIKKNLSTFSSIISISSLHNYITTANVHFVQQLQVNEGLALYNILFIQLIICVNPTLVACALVNRHYKQTNRQNGNISPLAEIIKS